MWAALLLAEGQAAPADGPPWYSSLLMMMPILVLAYFLLLRPGRVQEQQRKALIAALKKNDRIVNQGGIIGIVESVSNKEDEVVLRGGLRITKSSVVRVIAASDGTKEQKEGGS
jgi:preprotein translocase subunit YajC